MTTAESLVLVIDDDGTAESDWHWKVKLLGLLPIAI